MSLQVDAVVEIKIAALIDCEGMAGMTFDGVETDVISRRFEQLCGRERSLMVEFLLNLAEFDRRRGYEALGYATLWAYCSKHLHYGESETFRRTNAARLLQRHPEAADHLRDGRLNMSTLLSLKDVLTADNAGRLFEQAKFRSKKDVEYLVATLRAPAPVPATMIRKLPDRVVEVTRPELIRSEPAPSSALPESLAVQPAVKVRSDVTPHSEDRFVVRIAVSRAFVQKLEKAKSILSHILPDGDPAAAIERALDEVLERERRRHGPREKKDGDGASVGETHAVPAAVKREVWARDGSRCSWRMPGGGVCGSDHQVQEDHIIPRARGGSNDASIIRLLCRPHNLMHARQTFRSAFIDSAIDNARRRRADG